jgi:hypothetical protein
MVKQMTFEDLSQREVRKRVGPELARRMIALLIVHNGKWLTRADFRRLIGLDDRQVRLGREASNGRICYGQNGLKLMRDLTLAEWKEYEGRLKADETAAISRRLEAIRRYHGKKYMEKIA